MTRTAWPAVAILAPLALVGCAGTPSPPRTVERVPPAALVAPCPAQPEPREIRTDRDLALWIVGLAEAGAACRAAHSALARWAAPAAAD